MTARRKSLPSWWLEMEAIVHCRSGAMLRPGRSPERVVRTTARVDRSARGHRMLLSLAPSKDCFGNRGDQFVECNWRVGIKHLSHLFSFLNDEGDIGTYSATSRGAPLTLREIQLFLDFGLLDKCNSNANDVDEHHGSRMSRLQRTSIRPSNIRRRR